MPSLNQDLKARSHTFTAFHKWAIAIHNSPTDVPMERLYPVRAVLLRGDRLQNPDAKILTNSLLAATLNLMEITHLSSEGQVIIPEALRAAHHWEAGQELVAIDVGDGVLLKPKKPFPETTLTQVAGCLKYQGTPKSLDQLEEAIHQGVMEQWRDRS
jgi:bifunctional DNA-binding transcriptional regulator/antitoxin component of YhaV-PrlF toxin-antitoxin module